MAQPAGRSAACGERVPDPLRVRRRLGLVGVPLARPEETAQAVAPRPGHHVYMQVRDALADHVVQRDESALGAEGAGRAR